MMKKDSTDNCYLDYDEDGHLTCTYNHKAGDECLLDDREENELLERICNVAEYMNLIVPEIKTDPRHLNPDDEDFKDIEKTIPFKMFVLNKRLKHLARVIGFTIEPLIKKISRVKYLPELIFIIGVAYIVTSLVFTLLEK